MNSIPTLHSLTGRKAFRKFGTKHLRMDETKEFADKMVKLTVAQAEMNIYKHLNDYMKKYVQKLQRELNEVNQKMAKMDKKGIKGNDYGILYVKSHVLDFQIQKAKMLDLEFLSRAMEVSDNCPLKETQDLFKRFKEMQ